MARNQYGKDLELQAEASRRYRSRQAEQREWFYELASCLGVQPHQLLNHSAAAVADLIRGYHQNNETQLQEGETYGDICEMPPA